MTTDYFIKNNLNIFDSEFQLKYIPKQRHDSITEKELKSDH